MISAIGFGLKHESCAPAMVWRRSLGDEAMQADAWLACKNGIWLLWQLSKLPREQRAAVAPAVLRAVDRIVARAIRRGVRSIRGVRAEWATKYRRWARRWLSGEDRTAVSAGEAAEEAWSERVVEAARAARAAEVAVGEEEAWVWAAGVAEARVAVAWTAEVRELRQQARNVRREIPEWPGE